METPETKRPEETDETNENAAGTADDSETADPVATPRPGDDELAVEAADDGDVEGGAADAGEDNDDIMIVSEAETADHEPEVLTTEEVRQGHTGDNLRYVLAASVVGALVVLLLAYFLFLR